MSRPSEMPHAAATYDTLLRGVIYRTVTASGSIPSVATLAERSRLSEKDVRAALARLSAGRMLVLQPESGEILMAPPFSAVPTPFLVEVGDVRAYANCIWDALGVPVMLRRSGRITTACGCCGEAMQVDVSPEGPAGGGLVHFAVPAAKWWIDIVFT